MYSSEGGDVAYRAAEGLIFPILADDGDWLQVITTCNAEEWVRRADVEIVEQVAPATPGPGFELSRAVIVVDPGHGGRDLGAVGATSAYESNANPAIATILRDRLLQAEDVDVEPARPLEVGHALPQVVERDAHGEPRYSGGRTLIASVKMLVTTGSPLSASFHSVSVT